MPKLLIIDDSTALLEVMKSILERSDYEVKTLETTTGIYKQIDDFNPDLLIIDINLSGQDGRNICMELRKKTETKNLCILAISGFRDKLKDYKDFCADDVLEKPFDLKSLVAKIKLVMKKCKSV